ncbi:hypothetical protein LXA47_22810 [Massilia sp. P8910]|uniref:hypothetical protein n=1 Tax=Massilia antarctica TaxID=2765360 RepID=UPI001E571C4A|nr:hypothetical protein [Massilia antarctica]MCE3606414.1 hypothetical protein [Massilia antarctica]
MSTQSAAQLNLPVPEVPIENASSLQARNVLMGLFDSTSTASKAYLVNVARSLAVADTIAALSATMPLRNSNCG